MIDKDDILKVAKDINERYPERLYSDKVSVDAITEAATVLSIDRHKAAKKDIPDILFNNQEQKEQCLIGGGFSEGIVIGMELAHLIDSQKI